MAVSFSESVPPQICGVAMPPQVCGWGAVADCHPCPYGGAATARIQSEMLLTFFLVLCHHVRILNLVSTEE